jgi:SNF2 family DNA or RNA helicase
MAFRDMTMKKVSQFKWVAKPEADQVIAQWMQPAIRHAREDCFELPDVQTLELHADMTKHQRDLVKTLTDEARAILADGQEITAANAAAVLTKILQVEAGGIYDADHEVHRVDAKPYFEAIEGVLDQADTPVLIFVNFRSSAQATADYLEQKGFRIGRVLGGSRERAALFDAFQAGELDAIVAVPSTMSHGLTLTRSRIVVWASPPFSFETYEQANGRVIRRGQKNNVLIYHLVQTSLDKDLFSRLESRQRLQEAVLNLLTIKEVTK